MWDYLFNFHGRINRARLWWFYVVVWVTEFVIFLGIILAYAVLYALGLSNSDPFSNPTSIAPGVALTIVFAISVVAVYYMYLAVLTKRLHDRNKSGRWILIYFVMPMILIFTPEILSATNLTSENSQTAGIAAGCMALVGMALYIWCFVDLYCLRGTAGDNQYGPDPLTRV